MNILFTKGNSIFSKLICWALDSEVSHVVLEYNGLVFHSNLKGVHIQPLDKFLVNATVVYGVKHPVSYRHLISLMGMVWGQPYDFVAFFLLGMRALLKKVGITLPKIGVHNITGMYLCTEFITQLLDGEELLLTPKQLYDKLRKRS